MSASETSKPQEGRGKRACLSCRRRRRWCDRALPNCLACTKARRHCDGYEPDVVRTFVNLDATNVSRPNKKQLLCEALAKSRDSRVPRRPHYHDLSANQASATSSYGFPSLGGLDVVSPRADFRQHVEALWRTFILSYCQTKDYWPPGCSLLALRNKALDLALVALSAHRLSLNSSSSNLRLLSLTAYNNSIGLYRDMMLHESNDILTAILAVTSTVYALIEASLMQPEDIADFGWGKSGHFDGALALICKGGPHIYSASGFHHVFKKIREMGFFLAVSRRQETFLSTEEWMKIPWKSQPKTCRDRLYDLAIAFSEVVARSLGDDQASSRRGAKQTLIDKALRIEADINIWKSSWLNKEYPHLQIGCDCQPPAPFSCVCSVPISQFPTNAFALLQVECWALQLLISTTLNNLVAAQAEFTTSWGKYFPIRSSQIACCMEVASTIPTFRHTAERSSGITEGLCRTVFPDWVLREYRSTNSGGLPLDVGSGDRTR